ncbi:MAG: SlyX family protein [Cellvibrionaceae bacterium]
MAEPLDNQIIELQTRIQFQEDALNKLDEVVIRQGELVDRLGRKITELEDKLEQMRYEQSSPQASSDEKPPHY